MRRDRLDSLRVISPCTVPWDDMKGDDAVRFCGQCRKNVYNVAQLSRAEAVALIERAEGRVCMQLTRRADGTIVTGDCWAQLRRARKRGLLALAVATPAILLATLWSQAFGLRALCDVLRPRPVTLAGELAPLPRVFAGGVKPALPDSAPPKRGEVAAPPHRLLGKMAPPKTLAKK